jgi:hypothetical protein
LKKEPQAYKFPVPPSVVCFLHDTIIEIEEIELSLQGKLVIRIQEVESKCGARTLMRSGIPSEP